mmetsp:Transcript_13147/g.42031  ORF Transcript_13147/g.42031 Transcript_13147/m.42031 type:complete len:250 (+) Transcript_13147:300-1049(+)
MNSKKKGWSSPSSTDPSSPPSAPSPAPPAPPSPTSPPRPLCRACARRSSKGPSPPFSCACATPVRRPLTTTPSSRWQTRSRAPAATRAGFATSSPTDWATATRRLARAGRLAGWTLSPRGSTRLRRTRCALSAARSCPRRGSCSSSTRRTTGCCVRARRRRRRRGLSSREGCSSRSRPPSRRCAAPYARRRWSCSCMPWGRRWARGSRRAPWPSGSTSSARCFSRSRSDASRTLSRPSLPRRCATTSAA